MSGRIRSIKPEWLEDEGILRAGSDARVLTVALILLADDYGRGRFIEQVMCAQVFPFEPNPLETFREALARLSEATKTATDDGFVRLYSVRSQRYFEIRNWAKHQKVDKPGKPRVPAPSSDSGETRKDSRESRESLAPDHDHDHDHDQGEEGSAPPLVPGEKSEPSTANTGAAGDERTPTEPPPAPKRDFAGVETVANLEPGEPELEPPGGPILEDRIRDTIEDLCRAKRLSKPIITFEQLQRAAIRVRVMVKDGVCPDLPQAVESYSAEVVKLLLKRRPVNFALSDATVGGRDVKNGFVEPAPASAFKHMPKNREEEDRQLESIFGPEASKAGVGT